MLIRKSRGGGGGGRWQVYGNSIYIPRIILKTWNIFKKLSLLISKTQRDDPHI